VRCLDCGVDWTFAEIYPKIIQSIWVTDVRVYAESRNRNFTFQTSILVMEPYSIVPPAACARRQETSNVFDNCFLLYIFYVFMFLLKCATLSDHTHLFSVHVFIALYRIVS